ncbi:pimeloyl-ACP methyl ester carboxylesterase [Luteibacter sp. OK325]|nr:pimeloyl-ACP methyl ester carboxylesterase [Luteibacter sp. OK325]
MSDSFATAPVSYRTVTIDGLKVAYREAGSKDKPTLLLLHGVPSSSRMYDALMRRLGRRFHLVAPDYPGFGNSDAPAPDDFVYTFEHLAEIVAKFTDALGLDRYVLFMQDYGAPVGMRLAVRRPAAVLGTIFQNGNVYDEGLGAVWEKRKAFWSDRDAHEAEVRRVHLLVETTRARHIGSDPDVEAYDPDLWMDEYAFLNRPGEAAIQSELIYDYQNNLSSYPSWQAWLKQHQLPTLVVWGKHDLAFIVAGAEAFKGDLPDAKVVVLDAGHFAMDTRLDDVVSLTDDFMQAHVF